MTRRIALLLVVVTLCMGCGGRIGMRQLQELEAQLDSVPHLVRQGLDSIPFASLDDEERALYAILRTQADYKCYVPLTTDTLIRYATDYYNTDRKNYRAAMAWYSLGCVNTELGDDAGAVEAYLQAQSLFPDTTVRYYRLCYQNLGQHYLNKDMTDEALAVYTAYHNIAEGYDLLYADIGLAQAYIYNEQPEQAREILENLLQRCAEMDTLSLETILFDLGKIEYTFFKDYDKAEAYFDQLVALYGSDKFNATHWFKGDIAESRGHYDTAKHYYQKAMQGYDEVYLQYNCARSLLYLTLDSTAQPELYGYIKRFEEMGDSIKRIERRSEIDDIRTAHAMELHQRELSDHHRRFMHRTTLIVVCLLAAITIGMLLIERRRKQHYLRLQKELQRNQAKIYKMYESIEENGNSSPHSREEILAIYRDSLNASIALFNKSACAKRLQGLNKLRNKDVGHISIKEREELYKTLDENFITVITYLRDEADKYSQAKLSSLNVYLILLLAMGYSTGVIRECLAVSADNAVTQQKKRVLSRLPDDILHMLFDY